MNFSLNNTAVKLFSLNPLRALQQKTQLLSPQTLQPKLIDHEMRSIQSQDRWESERDAVVKRYGLQSILYSREKQADVLLNAVNVISASEE